MPATTAFTLSVPLPPPTLNSLMRGKRRDRIRLSKEFRRAVGLAALADQIPRATGKRRVTITVILGPRQRGADPDAFFKSTGDALKHAGLLMDDDRHGVEWAPVQYERGEHPACRITLEDIDGEED